MQDKARRSVAGYGLAYCVECHDEQPPLPVAEWDRLAKPATVASLEMRIAKVEKILADWTGDK